MNKLNAIFKIVSFLDNVRWHSENDGINYYKPKELLRDDTKILTHWLCYITDRQMPFERIWNIGGYVFSDLADSISNIQEIDLLNPDNPRAFIKKKDNEKGYIFISRTQANENSILRQYELAFYDKVEFSSRYYPSDYFSILYTLVFLEKYDFTLSNFIKEVYEKYRDKDDFIKRLLYSLYLMTYYNVGQHKKDDIKDFDSNLNKARKRTENLKKRLDDKSMFEREYLKFIKRDIFHQKRAWCSLRDYMKSLAFNKYLRVSLNTVGINDMSMFTSENALSNLELPGDVWNNNSKFRKCILSGTKYNSSNKIGLNKLLREYFEEHKNELANCYPEQFDVTFDYVPRMCEKDNCDICPISEVVNNKETNFKKVCVKNKSMYCSVAITACNYKIDCYGDSCQLLEILN